VSGTTRPYALVLTALAIFLTAATAQDGGDAAPPALAAMAPGEGREATYYACAACHSIRLVTQQGLSRARWDHLLDWMVDKQGMPELADEQRAEILAYLAENYGPRAGPRRSRRR